MSDSDKETTHADLKRAIEENTNDIKKVIENQEALQEWITGIKFLGSLSKLIASILKTLSYIGTVLIAFYLFLAQLPETILEILKK